jgi:hypothetical protein
MLAESGTNDFPRVVVILISGSEVLKMERTRVSSPLKTESTMISAMVPTDTPATETAEIIFIAFLDFFAKRYLFAIYRESFT